jgi:hypothetical protein
VTGFQLYGPGEPVPDREPPAGTEAFQVIAAWPSGRVFELTVRAADREGAELLFHELLRGPECRAIVQLEGEPERVEVLTPDEYLRLPE